MKVVHVIFNLKVGGTEMMLTDILRQQIALGEDVSVILINKEHDQKVTKCLPSGVKVYEIKRPTGSKSPWYYLKYNILINRLRPDIVHFHNDRSIGMTFLAGKTKVVATVHQMEATIPFAVKRADALYAISKAVSQDIKERYGRDASVVYNGIQTSALQTRKDIYPHSPFRIVQIGRLEHTIKGQDLLLKAAYALKDKGVDVDVTFIGGGSSKEYLQRLAKELRIDDIVRFADNMTREDIYSQLQDFDLFVQPSNSEGFGLTVAEAMAAKVPVLISDLTGPMEVIKGGEYGMTFAKGSVEDLTDKIEYAINNYSTIASKAQHDGYNWVRSSFDIHTTASSYLSEYAKLLNK